MSWLAAYLTFIGMITTYYIGKYVGEVTERKRNERNNNDV
jgi:membrane protein YqaA with SNARE-associated domain